MKNLNSTISLFFLNFFFRFLMIMMMEHLNKNNTQKKYADYLNKKKLNNQTYFHDLQNNYINLITSFCLFA